MFCGIPPSELPDAPRYDGKSLIICGGAACVWDDLEPLIPYIGSGTHVMAVNDVGMHIPVDIRHWFSNSAKDVGKWAECRRRGYNQGATRHALRRGNDEKGANYLWPWPGHGTSSLNAVYTGLAMGYESVVLCGIPLDNQPNYFSPKWEKRNFTHEVPDRDDGTMKYWTNARDKFFEGRVKSRSGRTKELLGAP